MIYSFLKIKISVMSGSTSRKWRQIQICNSSTKNVAIPWQLQNSKVPDCCHIGASLMIIYKFCKSGYFFWAVLANSQHLQYSIFNTFHNNFNLRTLLYNEVYRPLFVVRLSNNVKIQSLSKWSKIYTLSKNIRNQQAFSQSTIFHLMFIKIHSFKACQ